MKKIIIKLESFGESVRLTPANPEIDAIPFINLVWLMGGETVDLMGLPIPYENYTGSKAKLAKAIFAFTHPNGGIRRNLSANPYCFEVVSQQQTPAYFSKPYAMGSNENVDYSNNLWEGYASKAERCFDKVPV